MKRFASISLPLAVLGLALGVGTSASQAAETKGVKASLKDQLKIAQLQRRRPGSAPPKPYQLPPQPEPNVQTGLQRTQPVPPRLAPDDFIPIEDRWRLVNDLGLVEEKWYDPYNRNLLKLTARSTKTGSSASV